MLTSTLKLFLREMDQPLITKDVRDGLYNQVVHDAENFNIKKRALPIRQFLEIFDPLAYPVLRYLLFHLKRVADTKGKQTTFPHMKLQ